MTIDPISNNHVASCDRHFSRKGRDGSITGSTPPLGNDAGAGPFILCWRVPPLDSGRQVVSGSLI